MSQSMAKRIRKFAEINGYIKKGEPKQYQAIKHKKRMYVTGPNGIPKLVPVEKIQIVCRQNAILKAIKEAVNSGQIALPSLKQLHAQAAEMKRTQDVK